MGMWDRGNIIRRDVADLKKKFKDRTCRIIYMSNVGTELIRRREIK